MWDPHAGSSSTSHRSLSPSKQRPRRTDRRARRTCPAIAAANPEGTRWQGTCWYVHNIRREFPLQFDIPVTYLQVAPEIELRTLEGMTHKDMKYSTRVKDEEGYPAMILINKATGEALKHSLGQSHPNERIQMM
ncbi:hypothetical protein U9M48_005179 [Paspalum notatum var. saurae]|uniref:Ubiquitin-fold modifier-conjugating enzyme 1 n=1 Tax=Paspalum notatum var. saurae TaxID=547442 RepID=A0AAQ3PQ93_PASNO